MRQAGEVTYTNCHEQRTGEGVAEFATRWAVALWICFLLVFVFKQSFYLFSESNFVVPRSDMEYALDKLDGAELGGRRIKLSVEGGGGRSRSRSRWAVTPLSVSSL